MTIKEQIQAFEGDKRTKEYKDLVDELKSIQERVNSLSSPISWMDVKWMFGLYSLHKGKQLKPCRCSGKIQAIVKFLKEEYGKE